MLKSAPAATLSALALALLILPAAAPQADPPAALDQAARERAQAHYAAVEEELRTSDVSTLSDEQRASRRRAIEALKAYRLRGDFGVLTGQPGERQPVFVDGEGRRCAVANLLHVFGEDALVARIASEHNDAYVLELAGSPDLLSWLHQVGLSLVEAARIQAPGSHGLPPPPIENDKPYTPGSVDIGRADFGAPGGSKAAASTQPRAGAASTGAGGSKTTTAPPARTGSRTAGRDARGDAAFTGAASVDEWWSWWEMNKLRFIVPRRLAGEQRDVSSLSRISFSGPYEALVASGRRAEILPLLIMLTRDDDALLRARAATALGRLAGPDAVYDLLPLLHDPDLYVRHMAILALGATGAPDGAPVLERLARDGTVEGSSASISPIARPLSVLALGLGRRRGLDGSVDSAVALLAEQAGREDRDDVGSAAFLYDTLVPGGVLQDLAMATFADDDADRALRSRAAETLREAGDPAFLPELQHLLGARDLEVRRSAALALGSVSHPLLVPALQTAFELEKDSTTRGFLLITLGEQGGGTARDFLVKTLRSGSTDSRSWCALALGILARNADDAEARNALRKALLAERNHSVADAFVIAAGLARDAQSTPVLCDQLDEAKDPRTRMFAALALGLIGGEKARAALLEHLAAEESSLARIGLAQGLAMFGEADDAPVLIDTLRTMDDAEQQALVAVALGFHGTPAALTGLIAAARDESLAAPARASAFEALGLVLDPHPGLMLSDISRSANFFDFPAWLTGALTSVTL